MIKLNLGKAQYNLVNISHGVFDFDIQGHTHADKSYELHFVYQGCGMLYTKDNSYKLEKNKFYVTGPNLWHKQMVDKANYLGEITLYIQSTDCDKDALSLQFENINFWFCDGNENLEKLFFDVVKLNKKDDVLSKEKLRIAVEQIMLELVDLAMPIRLKSENSTIDDKKFLIIEDAFLFDYADITLESLSKKLGVSQRQTQRLLQKYYSKSFRQKKIDAKMEMAMLLLQQGASVSSVASKIGYSDTPSFIRAFKNIYGISPSMAKN
jgi:AraC-like DNA-binding protein